jgi:predicted RecA/RadA family phage recombinase
MSVTAATGQAYGFSADGGTLRLTNTEVIAYNNSAASAESVAVQVQANQTANVLLMTNCRCPITARGGYKQSNVVKINSGKYALVGNALGMAAAKYSTGDGMTELATILI